MNTKQDASSLLHAHACQRVIESWAEERLLFDQFATTGHPRAALLELDRAVEISEPEWTVIFNFALQLRASREVGPEETFHARIH